MDILPIELNKSKPNIIITRHNEKNSLVIFLMLAISFNIKAGDEVVFIKEYIGQMSFIEGRLTQLLGTMSQDQMSWTPSEGVRTCGKIYFHVAEAAEKLSEEDLNKVAQTPFGMEMSVRNFMISLLCHSHEHLGQGVAYARMNGVTPPWSVKDYEG